jgi:L-alanine-DL-glutamate epimerase-like enolase superfamily enzyme
MKIAKIRTTLLLNPDGPHFQDSTMPEAVSGLAIVLLEIETDAGHTGVATGQSPMRPFIHQVLEGALIGADPFQTEKIWHDMFWRVRGSGRKGVAFQAISAIDNAIWDIKAKALGMPLHRLLGSMHERLPVYGSGGWTNWSTDHLVQKQLEWMERGFTAIKIKVGKNFGRAEAEDVRRVEAVRKAVGDDVTIYIDANNGYYAKQSIRLAEEYKQLGVAWFEEPVLADDIPGLAQVAAATTIPVATGEHEYTKYGFRDLLSAGAADIVQSDIAQVGGVTEWLKIAHLTEAFNLPLAPHAWCLLHLHPALASPNLMTLEWLDLEELGIAFWFVDHPTPKDGTIEPDDRPGNGLVIDPHAVEKFRVD